MQTPLNRPAVLALGNVDSATRVISATQVRELERHAASAANAGQRIEQAELRCLADLESTKHSAWQRGYARGHAEALESLHAFFVALDSKRKTLEAELIGLIIDAINRVVRDLPADLLLPGLIAAALEETQADRGRLTLRVHPANADVAERWLELPAPGREHLRIDVEIDASIPTDGCVLETPAGSIDASLATQLAALQEHLLRGAA
jgi:flagellar biosynthesis/type III secretory pathway protein FliH